MDVPGTSKSSTTSSKLIANPIPQRITANNQGFLPINREWLLQRSPSSAFTEVSELRTQVSMLLPVIAPLQVAASAAAANSLAALPGQQATLLAAAQSAFMRKRPAPTPQPPECPVSIRPPLPACPLPNAFLQYPWLLSAASVRPPSPTLAAPAAPVHLPSNENAQTTETVDIKWSSPSSVDSNGQKTDSSTVSAVDSGNIDIIGDGSESSSSSTSTQAMVASPKPQPSQQFVPTYNPVDLLPQASQLFFQNKLQQQQQQQQQQPQQPQQPQPQQQQPLQPLQPLQPKPEVTTLRMSHIGPISSAPERKHRKPVNDDIVKLVKQYDLSAPAIAKIKIPVPKATECDPAFRPVSEQQIILQIVQGKKYEEMEVNECMIQLCKKLAEKRVFGPRLMSQTTVAGLNHSNYSNLPILGICYIQHVCRQVLGDKITSEEDFWDKFRESMRKLAARCRRVRHAKKTKSNREESLNLARQVKQFGEASSSFEQTIQNLGLTAAGLTKDDTLGQLLQTAEGRNTPVGQLILNLAAQNNLPDKKFKLIRDNETSAMDTLLNMANNCGLKTNFLAPKQEPINQ